MLALLAFANPVLNSQQLNHKLPEYFINYTLKIFDNQSRVVQQLLNRKALNSSTFLVPHQSIYYKCKINCEVFSKNQYTMQKNLSGEQIKINKVVGIGDTQFQIGPPLSTKSDEIELSDMLLGRRFSKQTLFPFPVMPVTTFNKINPLKVYLEIYHLKPDSSDIAHFQIEFNITKLEKRHTALVTDLVANQQKKRTVEFTIY